MAQEREDPVPETTTAVHSKSSLLSDLLSPCWEVSPRLFSSGFRLPARYLHSRRTRVMEGPIAPTYPMSSQHQAIML